MPAQDHFKFLVVSPFWRGGVPLFIGAVIGLLTNLLSTHMIVNGTIVWERFFTTRMPLIILVLIVISVMHQVWIHKYDLGEVPLLQKAKERIIADIGNFYAKKLKTGEINDLVEADQKMRSIFEKAK
ncbi:MAG: hypothetical protein WCS31_07225 [Verrucomicrobiae bacterium]